MKFDIVIFMVDNAARDTMDEAYSLLSRLMHTDELKSLPFVVLANKSDLSYALCESDLRRQFKIPSLLIRNFCTFCFCALSRTSLYVAGGNDLLTSHILPVLFLLGDSLTHSECYAGKNSIAFCDQRVELFMCSLWNRTGYYDGLGWALTVVENRKLWW
jgi:hypothetical protein